MESTKKKTSKRSAEREKERDEDTVMSSQEQTTPAPSKTRKTKSSSKKDRTSSSQADATEETTEQTTTTTTTSSSTTILNTPSPVAATTTTTNGIPPSTPINKNIHNLSSVYNTPGSPSRNAHRLVEKSELNQINKQLRECFKKIEEQSLDIDRKSQEIDSLEKQYNTEINGLRVRLNDAENRLGVEIKAKAELELRFDNVSVELKNRENAYNKDKEEILFKMDETINQITQDHLKELSSLRADIAKRDLEISSLKNEIKHLQAELQSKVGEIDNKTRKLLENEYSRMKDKENEFHSILQSKDDEIKKLKQESRLKDKSTESFNKKEAELLQTIQAYERQMEDIRDSINREWEVRVAQLTEEQTARNISLDQSVNLYADEKERLKGQINVIQAQVQDINIKNNELEDKIIDLNNELKEKNDTIANSHVEVEHLKKTIRKLQAELKNKDSSISLLQDEINGKENKFTHYQGEISRLKAEVHSLANQNEPDILLTNEIKSLREVVHGFEQLDHKRKRQRFERENPSNPDPDQPMSPEQHQQHQQQPKTSEANGTPDYTINTASIFSVDSINGSIKITVKGDFDKGYSISGWKLLVVRPDETASGFSFPENIQPVKGFNTITVWTGRQRPQNVHTPNEFYWSRQGIWADPVEGSKVKLTSPNDVTTTVLIPANGVYVKEEPNELTQDKSNGCIIM
eukprot:gene2013-2477_t